MAKGYDEHLERQAAIGRLGKNLARRAGRRCEWCEGKDDLRPYDHQPKQEPSEETLALLCADCRELCAGDERDPQSVRFLEGAIWSEIPAIREPALAQLRRLDAEWAREALSVWEETGATIAEAAEKDPDD